jgi:hypothetical protein
MTGFCWHLLAYQPTRRTPKPGKSPGRTEAQLSDEIDEKTRAHGNHSTSLSQARHDRVAPRSRCKADSEEWMSPLLAVRTFDEDQQNRQRVSSLDDDRRRFVEDPVYQALEL